MKKLIAIAVAVALVLSAFAVAMPISAEPDVVYETELVPQLQNTNVGNYSSVALEKGEVKVYSDGGYKVEIEGLELNEALFTGDLEVILWDIEYKGGNWQRKAYPNQYAATPATISLEDGEGKLEVLGDSAGSISSVDHAGFVAQVTDPGVAYLLTSGFSIP